MSHYITTHNADGKAVFSNKIPTEHNELPIPIGTIKTISSTNQFPMNLSTESDIEQYESDRQKQFFPGERRICPEHGTATIIIRMAPNAGSEIHSGMHRTKTFDVIVVIEGEIECHLDSGEKQTLKVGDSIVQRGTMHKWVNVTPNNGWAKWIAFIQAAEPLVIGEKMLSAEWAH